MNLKMAKKQLIALSANLGAEKLANNIIDYENVIKLIKRKAEDDESMVNNFIIGYSVGSCGNNGRIDKIINYDTDESYYICWY